MSICSFPVISTLGLLSETCVFQSELLTDGKFTGEVKGWAKMQSKAYQKCLRGLATQAKARGAAGVIDVKFVRQEREWDKGMTELAATGTAIAVPSDGEIKKAPFVCTLTFSELRRLRQAGHFPAGHVIGFSAYRQIAQKRVKNKIGGLCSPNTERSDFTRGVYAARKLAMRRLEEQAAALHAAGIINIKVTMTRHAPKKFRSERLVIGFIAQGTAIYDAPPSATATPFVYGVSLASNYQ